MKNDDDWDDDPVSAEDELEVQRIRQGGLDALARLEGFMPCTEMDHFELLFDGLPGVGAGDLVEIVLDVVALRRMSEKKLNAGGLYFWEVLERGLSHFVRVKYDCASLEDFLRLATLDTDTPS